MKTKIYLTSILLSIFALQFAFNEVMGEPRQETQAKQTAPGTNQQAFKRNPEWKSWDSSPHG